MKKQVPQSPSLPVLPNGIEKIALSFSGGGFRAAAFTLGCASYLNHLQYRNEPLLHKVKFISSASGGSITNMAICSMLREGKNFDAIYAHLKQQMKGTDLMDEVFRILADNSEWKERPDKSRNLINAFAMAYDRTLFAGATFHSLHQTPAKSGFVIAETCINTTEFDNGMNFRWGTDGVLGNKYLYFDPKRKAADKIKLGDILASSSCFPGGFEPIMFPRDFTWKNKDEALTKAELDHDINEINNYNGKETDASKANKEITFGFMDGGIDDNQGIYAFELADQRKEGHYDLYFPCDVSSNFLDAPFTYPAAIADPKLQLTASQFLIKIKKNIRTYFIISILALLASAGLAFFPAVQPVALVLAGLFLAAIILPFIAALVIKKQVSNVAASLFPSQGGSGSWGLIFNKYKGKLLNLPLSSLITMLIARATSVLLLAVTVYLKRIRQISYKLLYADKANDVYNELVDRNNANPGQIDPGSLWKDHIGVTTVYQLSEKNDFMLCQILQNAKLAGQSVSPEDKRKITDVLYPVGETLQKVADIAASVATTLWFDDNQQLQKAMESLIAAGQATICFNLIVMAYQFGNDTEDWIKLKAALVKDWEMFKEKPFELV